MRTPPDRRIGEFLNDSRPARLYDYWLSKCAAVSPRQIVQTRIRVLLADDHAIVRTAISRTLEMEPDLEVIGEAVDGLDAIEKVERLTPDVVVMDINMPRMSGVEATRLIASAGLPTRIIGLSMHQDEAVAQTMLTAGAIGYLSKCAPLEQLAAAIRAATCRGSNTTSA